MNPLCNTRVIIIIYLWNVRKSKDFFSPIVRSGSIHLKYSACCNYRVKFLAKGSVHFWCCVKDRAPLRIKTIDVYLSMVSYSCGFTCTHSHRYTHAHTTCTVRLRVSLFYYRQHVISVNHSRIIIIL